ncbi:hypothetical protein ACFOYU_05695 [Microvirga sp. GCM10011540]|uniref:hypothetical protein n=1 Tax=Microvirga sp. GCM10011540 TaxID=3317338 RepID=UPI00361F982F
MQTSSPSTTPVRPADVRVPAWLQGRRGLVLISATVALGGSLVMGWPWLVAAGIAPLLLTAAPCLAMCALGLCMKGMPGRSCSTTPSQRENQQ